ncbi:MAG TPA: peptidyl-prolyl cis-trans isomerase [Acidobacteriota bacterium]|jgi:parvulin-like peptidyl-prolyl isomerase|nr:peptidyl-prolyl cis-trans isomerase [Acidobacteriota bacterium]HNT16360.1 peptidyl-prolyl cis-trans isomerase [Acidobacteriota bacterium]HPA26508.1 peptidyl-prolyl cis-trans isomerase [Acidobacteriota bacterium]HQO19818.1 peptidyl-prolyl cis-trans isomerase [Acidobacteriota bacterium]HQQ46647.1 peptidyl-prolyl cis-trans isomerase [Acidobacteriota bacterium]
MRNALFIAAILVLSLACSRQENDPSARMDTVATVGAFFVTVDDLDREVRSSGQTADSPALRSRLFDALVDEVLILNGAVNAAEEGQLRPLGEYADPRKRKETASMLLEEKVYSRIEVSTRDVEDYYNRRRSEFARGEGVLVRQMTLGGGNLKNEAMDLLQKKHSFEDVARLYSISPDRGRQQYFEMSELPEYLVPFIMTLREGQVSKPIEISKDTFQVILLEKRAKEFVLPLDMIRQMVRLHLSDMKGEELRKDFLDSLRKRYNVHLFYERLPFGYVKEN